VIVWAKNPIRHPKSATTTGTSKGVLGSGRLFSRDLNYLRDLALAWPFIIFSIIAVPSMFSRPDRQLGIRCAGVAIAAILLTKETLVIFFAALGLVAIRGTVWLVIRPWSWPTFWATALTGIPFLVANRYWRNPKLAYEWPDEFGAVDALLSFASICGTLFLFYLISNKWGIR